MEIYKIQNLIDNKVYIGKTYKTFNYRYGRDWSKSSNLNKHLKNAVSKVGKDSFKISVIHSTNDNDHILLSMLETHYITLYSSNIPEHGYNFTSGGDGGTRFNEESRKKLSDSKKGKKPAHLHTAAAYEHRVARIRQVCCGKPMSEEHKNKLIERNKLVLTLEAFGCINTFNGIQEAANFYNVSIQTISRAIANSSATRTKVKWLKLIKKQTKNNFWKMKENK